MPVSLSILIGFRNRDVERVYRALESLEAQSVEDFELVFVDYGSEQNIAEQVKALMSKYSFARYHYSQSEGWLWNRAHAINTGYKLSIGKKILISDIDILYPPEFIKTILELDVDATFYTFGCYYLPKDFNYSALNMTAQQFSFAEFHGMGLTLAKGSHFFNISGYDEFYMIWGAEDDDLTTRLKKIPLERIHLPLQEFPLFHQWHITHSPAKPTFWYLTMVNYLFSQSSNRNSSTDWGTGLTPENRPILNLIQDDSKLTNLPRLQFWEDQLLLFFNPLIQKFYQLKSGESAYIEYEFDLPEGDESFIKKIFKSRDAVKRNSDKMDKRSIVNFLEYFIGTNRFGFLDYYLKISDKKLLFVVIKK